MSSFFSLTSPTGCTRVVTLHIPNLSPQRLIRREDVRPPYAKSDIYPYINKAGIALLCNMPTFSVTSQPPVSI